MGDEQHRPRERLQRRLQRLAALQVEVVRRLVEDEEVRAGGDDERERQPAPLAAGEHRDRLRLLVPAREEEAAEQVLRVGAQEPGRALDALQHRPARVELHLLLREVGGLDAVAEPDAALACSAVEQRLEQRGLAGAVRPDERDVLAALQREGTSSSSALSPAETARSSTSMTTRPLRFGFRNSKPSVRR